MFHLQSHRCRVPLALLASLAAAQMAAAQADPPSRAEIEPVPGVQVIYERQGPDAEAGTPARFDSSLATPAGTLRTTVLAVPAGEQHFQRGGTTFELPAPIFGGQLQLHELVTGGAAATWRAQFDAGLSADTRSEWTSVRSGQALHLHQQFAEGPVAHALLSSSRTALAHGARWGFELSQLSFLSSQWSAGIDAAERSYVSASGGTEPRVGMRMGAQWPLLAHTRMEARYTRQIRWGAEDPVSSVMLGTRFELPWRLSLVTGLETDADDHHKALLRLTVPLQPR